MWLFDISWTFFQKFCHIILESILSSQGFQGLTHFTYGQIRKEAQNVQIVTSFLNSTSIVIGLKSS